MESSQEITFHSEATDFELADIEKYDVWLQKVAALEEVSIEELTLIFCSDDYLLDINVTYLKHDYYTDIITFPYKQGKVLQSDIFISIDRVRENAATVSTTFHRELLRVMAHGLLHLIGYGDKTNDEVKVMRAKEEECILLFETMNK